MPDWYVVIAAAKYLGVAPWDLWRQPAIWARWALIARNAEIDGHNELSRRGS